MNTALGLLAGALTTASFLPQVLRAVRSGSTGDLSWTWLIMLVAGESGWIAFGVLTADISVIVANVVTVTLVGTLLAVKARHTLPQHALPRQGQ
jgi:MtN3 and saliva related transmembrane protein